MFTLENLKTFENFQNSTFSHAAQLFCVIISVLIKIDWKIMWIEKKYQTLSFLLWRNMILKCCCAPLPTFLISFEIVDVRMHFTSNCNAMKFHDVLVFGWRRLKPKEAFNSLYWVVNLCSVCLFFFVSFVRISLSIHIISIKSKQIVEITMRITENANLQSKQKNKPNVAQTVWAA